MKKLLCESNPMCYGSSTVLLSIIEQLCVETVCLAFGVAKEVLQNDKCELIEVNNKSSKDVETAIKEIDFDSVLVVSNTCNLALYKSLNKKVYFIHIHFFYSNANTEILNLADILFIQKFWNLQPTKSAVQVGPLIKTPITAKKNKDKIIVNFGGGESRFIQPGVNSDYGRLMLNLIIYLKPHFENKEIIICGGTKIIETIIIGATSNSIKAITLSNDDYLELLDEAEILISSPGLNAIFEAMYRNIPIVFLPPQNISQVYQLHSYEKAGIALKGLNLSIHNKFFSEEQLTLHFLKEMKSKYCEERIINRQVKIISKQLEYIRTNEYRTKIELAKLFLGDLGSQKISKIINNEMDYN
jgi:hypothetical protein